MTLFLNPLFLLLLYLPKRVGSPQLAEEHGDKLAPGAKTLGRMLGPGLLDQILEFDPRHLLQDLAEHASDLHRLDPLWFGVEYPGRYFPYHTS